MFRRLSRLIALLPLAGLVTACADNVSVSVAPNLGKTAECVEWFPMPEAAGDWLKRHPEQPPAEWFQWEDYQADRVQPKLAKDCEQ